MAKRLLSFFKVYSRQSRIPLKPTNSVSRLLGRKKLLMPKSESNYYAVRVGFKPGVYYTWEECQKQVNKFPGCKYKKFSKLSEALEFVGAEKPTELQRAFKPRPTIVDKNSETVPSPNTSAIRVWTDGCSLSNGKNGARAGVGVFWGVDDPRNLSERLPGPRQTNNRAEVMAIIRAVETCPNNETPLEIRTDSQYSMNAYNSWISNWEKNGWKNKANKDVENKDLFIRMMKLIRARQGKVIMTYVPGHAGVSGNEAADRLANMGALKEEVVDDYDCEANVETSNVGSYISSNNVSNPKLL